MQAQGFTIQDVNARSSYGTAPIAMMGQKHLKSTSAGRSGVSPAQPNVTDDDQRTLPEKKLEADTVEDDYVQFIFYCNPFLSTSTDTSELRRGFQSMPKTDGKSFDIFILFELIQKLEAKEIETWSQLVVEMGVEPPDVASGQSTQKVQQYAVRLKVSLILVPASCGVRAEIETGDPWTLVLDQVAVQGCLLTIDTVYRTPSFSSAAATSESSDHHS